MDSSFDRFNNNEERWSPWASWASPRWADTRSFKPSARTPPAIRPTARPTTTSISYGESTTAFTSSPDRARWSWWTENSVWTITCTRASPAVLYDCWRVVMCRKEPPTVRSAKISSPSATRRSSVTITTFLSILLVFICWMDWWFMNSRGAGERMERQGPQQE